MTIPTDDLTEEVTVSRYDGEGAYGAQYAPPVTTLCNLQAARKLVRNQAGDEVVSETTLLLSPDLDVDVEALFQPESLVVVRGRQSRVITVQPHLDRGLLCSLEVTTT